MSAATHPPRLEFARSGANPTLETLEYVRAVLRQEGVPLSRNRLLLTLASWGHATTRRSLNAALKFLAAEGCILEGSKGIAWVPLASAKLSLAIRRGRPL
jgi:hypothetical protein